MNEIDPINPLITAYALGELAGDENAIDRQAVEAILAIDPAARQFAAEVRASANLLSHGLRQEARMDLGDARRTALLAAASVESETTRPGLLRLHADDEVDSVGEDTATDRGQGTPLYHVITHPTAPRHWRRALLAVAAAVAIVASALTAVLSSLLRHPSPAPSMASAPSDPTPPPRIHFSLSQMPSPGSDHGLPDDPSNPWVGKSASELLPNPEAIERHPLFGLGQVIVIPLPARQPTTHPGMSSGAFAVSLESPFVEATTAPLSTVPLQTGQGSYASIKTAIEAGRWPEKSAVRIEELANAFHYDYAGPVGDAVFAGHLETAACPWNETHRLVRIGLKAKEGDAGEIVARDASLQVEFNPATVGAYRLIGYDRQLFSRPRESAITAPDLVAGHTLTAIYEIIPARPGELVNTAPSMKYQTTAGLTPAAKSDELLTATVRFQDAETQSRRSIEFAVRDDGAGMDEASTDFQFATATVIFGMVLRDSPHKGDATLDTVLTLAMPGLINDDLGARAQFVDLVKRAKGLKSAQAAHCNPTCNDPRAG